MNSAIVKSLTESQINKPCGSSLNVNHSSSSRNLVTKPKFRVFTKQKKRKIFQTGLKISNFPEKSPRKVENASLFSHAVIHRLRKRKKYCYEKRPPVASHLPPRRRYGSIHPTTSKTITDIDSEWFSIINGRPIATKYSQTKYIQDLRDRLRTKIQISHCEDEWTILEEQYVMESNAIDEFQKKFKAILQSFEDMLASDHSESMRLLHLAEEMLQITETKDNKINQIHNQLRLINLQVIALEEKWNNLKRYREFLIDIFGSIDDVTNGEDLMVRLNKIEEENLNSFISCEELSKTLENANVMLNKLQDLIEFESLRKMVNEVDESIKWFEDQSLDLENKTKSILNTHFRDVIAEDLDLRFHVEDLYETLISKNDANFGIVTMMKAIETFYEKLVFQSETISIKKTVPDDVTFMTQAIDVAKRMSVVERLHKSLHRSRPIAKKRELRPRSPIPKKKKIVKKEIVKELTEEDIVKLSLFSKWCQHNTRTQFETNLKPF